MLKNKSLVLLLTLLTYTTTYNKRTGAQAQLQQIPQQTQQPKPLGIQKQTSPLPKTSISTPKQQITITQQTRLSDSNFGAASVLPFIKQNNKFFFILSREAYGKAKGTYDDFGGSRDPGEDHPVITAAREFFEEAILPGIGFSLENTLALIDIAQSNKTQYVVVLSRNVTYITDFTAHAQALFNNFYSTRSKMKDFHFTEKDRLALVDWDLLKTTINNTMFNSGVQIDALVLDPQDLLWKPETIILRDFFVKKLRPFFMTKPYEQGVN